MLNMKNTETKVELPAHLKEKILAAIDLETIEDLDSRKNAEILRNGLLSATSIVDIEWHWLAYCAAESDRLAIKLTMMKTNKQ